MGRAIVLVKDDQLSLAIGRRGQNVRLASKLVGWDIEIMTIDEMNESLERAEGWFRRIPNISDDLVEAFITDGFMSFIDITFIEPTDLAEMGGITVDEANAIINYAEEAAERIENEKPEEHAVDEEASAGRTVAGHLADPETPPTDSAEEATSEALPDEASPSAEEASVEAESPAVLEASMTEPSNGTENHRSENPESHPATPEEQTTPP
jgi:N utilization substance protein A